MKKAARSAVVLITCSSLLYGCDVPTSLEDFVGWREKFFLHVDSSTIGNLLGPLLGTNGRFYQTTYFRLGISFYITNSIDKCVLANFDACFLDRCTDDLNRRK